MGAAPSRSETDAPDGSGRHGERPSPGSGDVRSRVSFWISSRSRPSASISASTPNSADWSSRPVSTVYAPWCCGASSGNADSTVAPRRPLIRIMYGAAAGSARAARGQQPQFPGALDGRGAVTYLELGVDAAQVRADGVERDGQFAGDLRPGQVRRQIPQHPKLARAELLRRRQWR